MTNIGRLAPVVLLLALPFSAEAALVNINTADTATLETLSGIGPTKAAAIVEYREAHGPFASAADIQNVSGIGPATYASIASSITVGDAPVAASVADDVATATPSTSAAASSPLPPSLLTVSITGSADAYLDVPASFGARVAKQGGAADPGASVLWNFGDGSTAAGRTVEKTYRYPGTYLVVATAVDGDAEARSTLSLTVRAAQVSIAAVSADGTTIQNSMQDPLDISGWRLIQGGATFRFPDGSLLPPGGAVLFPQIVTNLPVAFDAVLAYPDGSFAARYAPAQPPAPAASSTPMYGSTVTSVSLKAHADTAVTAPAASAPVAAAAGALSTASRENALSPDLGALPKSVAEGLLHSSWSYGFLGLLAAAGGAFLIF